MSTDIDGTEEASRELQRHVDGSPEGESPNAKPYGRRARFRSADSLELDLSTDMDETQEASQELQWHVDGSPEGESPIASPMAAA